jgi:hypothetical protein
MRNQWGSDIVEQAAGLPAFLAATEPVAPRAMLDLIPAFDWQKVVVAPWTVDIGLYGWMMLMAFLVTTACGLIGNYLLLRRLALVGDAISHSVLPGLVAGFLIFGSVGDALEMRILLEQVIEHGGRGAEGVCV